MKNHELEAVRLLGVYTARSFRLDCLLSNAKASCRAHIASTLNGAKVPQSKAGYNALRSAFVALAGIRGDYCTAEIEARLILWCKAVEAIHGWASDTRYGRKD